MIEKFKFTPIEGLQNESAFPDDPGDLAVLREQLQRLHNQTRDYINALTDKYSSNLVGKSGSNEIGSEAIAGLMDPDNPLLPALTVYAQIRAAQKNIDDLVAGIIPDGSINTQKLTEGAVTPSKISGGVGCNYIRNRIPAAGDNFAAGYKIGNTWTVPYMTLNNILPHPIAITPADWSLQNSSLAGAGSKGTLTCSNGLESASAKINITPVPGHTYALFGSLKVTSANVISEISVGTDKQINPVKNAVYNLCEIITAPTEFKIQIKAATAAALNAATLEFDKVCVVDMTADMAGVPFDKAGAIAYFSTYAAFATQIPEYAGMNWHCLNNGNWLSSSMLSKSVADLYGLSGTNATVAKALEKAYPLASSQQLSAATAALYGLSGVNANVDKAFEKATTTFFKDLGKSIADNGYVNIGGLIIQWGKFTTTSLKIVDVTFPIAFPTKICSQTVSINNNNTASVFNQNMSVQSTTGFQLVLNPESGGTKFINFIAIGY